MIDLLYSNPFRPIDARWQRAVGISDNGHMQSTPNRDGPDGSAWIKQAQRFKHAYDNATTHPQKLRVKQNHPHIYTAYSIFTRAIDERPLRWALEARLLARQTDREISIKMGCMPEVIKAYEALFFSVRERIDDQDFMITDVLGAAITRGLAHRDYDLLWKMFGYNGGPYVLDAMIQGFPNPVWAHTPDGVPMFFQDAAINLMKKKACISALAVPVDNHTQVHLIEAFVKYVEIERSTDSAGKAQEQIQQNLHSLLTGLKFSTVTVDKVKEFEEFDQGHVELRTADKMKRRLGLPLPDLKELSAVRFPGSDT